jgi:hypothetical protein
MIRANKGVGGYRFRTLALVNVSLFFSKTPLPSGSISIENRTVLLFELLQGMYLQIYYWYEQYVEVLQSTSLSRGYITR